MGSVMDVVEISSDDEDFSMASRKLPVSWAAGLFDVDDCGIGEDFDDVLVMSEFSVPPVPQKKGKPDGCGGDEEDDDCVVLDSDPDKVVALADDKESAGDGGSDELQIVAEKGPVACRDFPHSRHSCSNLPFSSTLHVKHCSMCHCFVCDTLAPCSHWGTGVSSSDHCHATDKETKWKTLRQTFKHKSLPTSHPEKHQNVTHPTIAPPREQDIHRQGSVRTSQPSLMSLMSNISHPSLVNQSPLLNAVSQIKQRQNLRNGGQTVCAPRVSPAISAGRGVIHAHTTQITRSRTRFKRVGAASPGLTTPNANQFIPAAQSNDLMHQALPRVSRPVQVELTANSFAGSVKHNAPQRSLSAPMTYKGQQAVPSKVASNGMHSVGPHLSRCSSLTTSRTQSMQGSVMDVCSLSWQDMLLSLASDLGVSDYTICTSQSQQPVRTSSQPLLSSTNQGLDLHTESVAATTNLMSSNGHDLSSHTPDGNVQVDSLMQTKQTSHHLNCQSSLGPNEAHQSFAGSPADGSMVEGDHQREYSELNSPDLFDFEIEGCY